MSDSARDLLVRGIAAAKAKDKQEACFYLEWVLRTDADTQQKIKAWLWLGEVSDDPAEKRDCLENILAHEPSNPLARRGLAILQGKLNPAEIIDPDRQAPTSTDVSPQPAATRRFVCPQCGGKLAFSPDGQSLACAYCNRELTLYQAIEEGAVLEEQDFAVALATARGHARPIATQSFTCQGCAAAFMLGPSALSVTCPYCASAHVVKLLETRELIPPEGIIPFALTQPEATASLQGWLKEKDLHPAAQIISLDGLYLPGWTFDVGGEVQWAGQPHESRYGRNDPVSQSGSYPIFYDDVLVPASHRLSSHLAQELNHFQLGALVPYDPGYLADWLAEIYQVSVADASLAARRQVWEQARRMASSRAQAAAIGNVTFSSAGMLIEAFKLILLPLWMARYGHQDEEYQAVVNGQTGAVRGEKPRSGLGKWLEGLLGGE